MFNKKVQSHSIVLADHLLRLFHSVQYILVWLLSLTLHPDRTRGQDFIDKPVFSEAYEIRVVDGLSKEPIPEASAFVRLPSEQEPELVLLIKTSGRAISRGLGTLIVGGKVLYKDAPLPLIHRSGCIIARSKVTAVQLKVIRAENSVAIDKDDGGFPVRSRVIGVLELKEYWRQ